MKIKCTYITALILFLLTNVNVVAGGDTEPSYSYGAYYNSGGCRYVYDPYENINRKIFAFNNALDTTVLRPLTKGYKNITTDYIKARIGNFLDNISVPLTMVNYGLQGHFNNTMKSFWRFFVNTTFGIGGLFDIASKMDITVDPQTFGSTLAHYGVGTGPYIMLPFFGPTNARDILDVIILDMLLNPIKYPMNTDFKLILFSIELIHDRMKILPLTDFISKTSSDDYISVRSAVFQNREYKVQYHKEFICPKVKR